MKVTFEGVTLADDANQDWLTNMQTSASFQSQVDNYLRGTTQGFQDRGNRSVLVSFSTTRKHASLRVAEEFYLEHAQAVIGKGDAVITCGIGGDTSTKTIAGCLLKASGTQRKGVSTTFYYTLNGPAVA